MGGVVAIGELSRLAGFALAGVDVRGAEDEPSANEVLDRLEGEVAPFSSSPRARSAPLRDGSTSERASYG